MAKAKKKPAAKPATKKAPAKKTVAKSKAVATPTPGSGPSKKTPANPKGKTIKTNKGVVVAAFKWCNRCKKVHPGDHFYANANRASGLSDWCSKTNKVWRDKNKKG